MMTKPNCKITRNFAYGDTQYKQGEAYLSGEAKDFAIKKNCAVMNEIQEPVVKKVKKPSKSKG